MAYVLPTYDEFKAFFSRDFPFAPDDDPTNTQYVTEADFDKAQAEARFNFNESFVADQAEYSMLMNYLTAHYLVIDLRAASQGLAGTWSWQEASKSVGSVSQSFGIPKNIQENPVFSMFTKTNYGAKYLGLIWPQLVGPIMAIRGCTHP